MPPNSTSVTPLHGMVTVLINFFVLGLTFRTCGEVYLLEMNNSSLYKSLTYIQNALLSDISVIRLLTLRIVSLFIRNSCSEHTRCKLGMDIRGLRYSLFINVADSCKNSTENFLKNW